MQLGVSAIICRLFQFLWLAKCQPNLEWAVWQWKEKTCREEFTSSTQRLNSSFQVEHWTATAEKWTKRKWKTHVQSVQNYCCYYFGGGGGLQICDVLVTVGRDVRQWRRQRQGKRHFGSCSYFAIIPSSFNSTMLVKYANWTTMIIVQANTENQRITIVCFRCRQNRKCG